MRLRRPAALATAAGRVVAGHRLFVGLLAAAAALRVAAQFAYRPALFFYGDSFAYLANAAQLRPESIRPASYPAFLRVVLWIHDLAVVPAVQHLLGLIAGTLVYALVRRLGVGPVGACIAAAPVLLDAYQLNIEQHILSEALFTLLIVAALVLLLWNSRPSYATCVAVGVLLAVAALTRSVGLALIAPALVFAIVRGGVLRTLALAAAFALPLLGYAAWYSSSVPHGSFSLTDHDGYFLYGRVADFASCDGLRIGAAERRVLCDPRPPADRPNPNYYVWHQWARKRYPGFPRLPVRRNAVLESFALGVIHHQPAAYARTVLHDMEHYAAFGRSTGRHDEPISEWQFSVGRRQTPRQVARLQLEVRTWGGSIGGTVWLQRMLRALPARRLHAGAAAARGRHSGPRRRRPGHHGRRGAAPAGRDADAGRRGRPGSARGRHDQHVRLPLPAARAAAPARRRSAGSNRPLRPGADAARAAARPGVVVAVSAGGQRRVARAGTGADRGDGWGRSNFQLTSGEGAKWRVLRGRQVARAEGAKWRVSEGVKWRVLRARRASGAYPRALSRAC